MRGLGYAIIAAIAAIAALGALYAQEVYYPNCEQFGFKIPHTCCCTRDCCAPAAEGEFEAVDEDNYRSTITGQVIKRTGYSRSGRFIRCACSFVDGNWTKTPGSHVFCLFAPPPST